MTTEKLATEKIAAGLANPEPEPDPLPENVAAVPATVKDLTNAFAAADAIANRMARSLKDIEDGIERSRREIVDRLSGMTSITPGQRDRVAADEAVKAHRKALAASEKGRYDDLRELQTVASTVEAAATLFANPVAMLNREGLGLERRTHLQQQLAGAGPTELRNMALLAVATGDLVLGAAVVTTLDRMPSSRRSVAPRDLATRMVGKQHQEASQLIAAVRNRMQSSIDANRALERRQPDSLARIRRAVARPAEGDVASRLAAASDDDGED